MTPVPPLRGERRRVLVLAVAAAFSTALGACTAEKRGFESVDITGADYAKDFRLTDSAGRSRSLSDFRGKAVVVFFGYTRCPDVCPTTMADLSAAMQALGPDAERVQVVFVTLDPARDTPSLLAQYVPSFDRRFIGLFGDEAATVRTAHDFKIFFQRVPGSTPDAYTIDHTAGSYVFDPAGHVRLFIRQGEPVAAVVHDLKQLLS